MALPPMFAPTRVSAMASESTVSADPFWQAPPKTAVASPSRQTTTAPPPPPAKHVRPVTVANRRPQCTHMTMKRLHGRHTCLMCGKAPSIGWVYVCQQDRDLPQDELPVDPDELVTVPNESDYFDAQALLAGALGMSTSVVHGIRNGDYSMEQVDKLIAQKQHLIATIQKQQSGSVESTPHSHQPSTRRSDAAENVIASVGVSVTPTIQPAAPVKDVAVSHAEVKNDGKPKKFICDFQVCRTCRPFFEDRLYMSFEQVLSGEIPALTEREIEQLPMLNPAIVRTIGLRGGRKPSSTSPPSPENLQRDLLQTDVTEDDDSEWTPTSATISETDSEKVEDIDRYPCPGAGVCPLYSRSAGCAYDTGFDDGLRALNHGFGPDPDLTRMTPENSLSKLRHIRGNVSDTPGGSTSTGSSLSLPTPSTVPLTPLTPHHQSFEDALSMRLGKKSKAATISGPLGGSRRRGGRLSIRLRGKDSSSSFGSEVEVAGGVALTEEAVETGVPDILTDDGEVL